MTLGASLLMVGATIMGTGFAFAIAPGDMRNRPLFTMISLAGAGIMIVGFLQF